MLTLRNVGTTSTHCLVDTDSSVTKTITFNERTMTENILLFVLMATIAVSLIIINKLIEQREKYRCRVFELTNGEEGSNLVKVVPDLAPPPPPKETTLTALYELDYKRIEEWREELCAHYRTDLTDVSTAWHLCKLDEEGRAVFPINIPADIAVRLFPKISNHLYRKLERHKQNMKKGPDIP